MPTRLCVLALVVAAAASPPALAQAVDDDGAAPGGPPRPLWEAGVVAFGVAQAAYPGSSQRVDRGLVLPWALYRGPLLRVEGGSAGLRAAKTPVFELDVGVAGAFGSSASDDSARRGLPRIGTLVEFGPRLRVQLGAYAGGRAVLALPLRGVFDLDDSLGYRGLAFEPALSWRRPVAGFNLGASVGLLVGNQRLTDTFYGVAPAFALPTRPAYEARAGLIATRLGLNLTRRLSEDWLLFAFARHDLLDGAANRASPLVERRSNTSAGIGLSWTFARSSRDAAP